MAASRGQSANVDPHLSVAGFLPGVILDHVEQSTDQVEHAVLGMVLETHTIVGMVLVPLCTLKPHLGSLN